MAGTLAGYASYAANPILGAMVGGMGGSLLGDVVAQDPDMPRFTGQATSPSTWMPLAMPSLSVSQGGLTPAAATTIGSGFGDDAAAQKRKAAALKQATAAQNAQALQYLLMGQQGGGGGGMNNMMLPMMMMMGQGAKAK